MKGFVLTCPELLGFSDARGIVFGSELAAGFVAKLLSGADFTVKFAEEVNGVGMVLPGGYDAESIVSQAIADLMSGKVRGPVAPTRQRLVKKLEMLIQGKIRLLTMLKETSVTRSEWDSDGGSALSQVRDETADVWQAVSAHEAEAARLQLKAAMKRSLDGEPDLAALLECRWKGMTDPAEMARELGLSEVEVVRARKRLDRRLAAVSKRRMDRENHR